MIGIVRIGISESNVTIDLNGNATPVVVELSIRELAYFNANPVEPGVVTPGTRGITVT